MGSMPIARPNMTMARSRAMGALGVTVPSPLPLRIPAAAQRLMAAKNQSWVLLSAKRVFRGGQLQKPCENGRKLGAGELTVGPELTVIALNDAVTAPAPDGTLCPVAHGVAVGWPRRARAYGEQTGRHGKGKNKR